MTDTLARETDLLTSASAADLLRTAITGDPSVGLPGFTVRLEDLHYRPGAEVSAVYSVGYDDSPGRQHTEHLVATTAPVTGRVATLSRAGVTLRVWRHPDDPRLPGLSAACDPTVVRGWLAAADPGLALARPPALDLLTYRPLRRAVLRARFDASAYFLKVLRPGYDDKTAVRQGLLAQAGLAVGLLARPAPGVLVSPATPGHSLAHVLADWQRGGTPPPSAAALVGLLDSLPRAALELPRRASWSEHLDFHAATARRQLPTEGIRIITLVGQIKQVLGELRHGPLVPTHGDFYEANVFSDEGQLRFIDIDSVGPGLREDDLACCLAHLAVLPSLDPKTYSRVPEVLAAWQAGFDSRVDPADLRARTAAVLLSLIAGASAGQDVARLELAEHYAAAALRPESAR